MPPPCKTRTFVCSANTRPPRCEYWERAPQRASDALRLAQIRFILHWDCCVKSFWSFFHKSIPGQKILYGKHFVTCNSFGARCQSVTSKIVSSKIQMYLRGALGQYLFELMIVIRMKIWRFCCMLLGTQPVLLYHWFWMIYSPVHLT